MNEPKTYLSTQNRSQCTGCEACVQICAHNALSMQTDSEGFRYPVIDENKCIECGRCYEHCPAGRMELFHHNEQPCFGGYSNDIEVLQKSTSGGAFSEIAKAWCDENYVIFGAAQNEKLTVEHTYITDISDLDVLRRSKYSQSRIRTAFCDCKRFLDEGKKVLFSGTPCQIAGLKAYLGNKNYPELLTVDVVCEGVPSPKYIQSFATYLEEKHKSKIVSLDYRDKDTDRWDFQVMSVVFQNGKTAKTDRWLNPFWDIWLKHIMSRPSCYECIYTSTNRVSDITLGDLWGVHIFCPELYNDNRGSSLMLCNTVKGLAVLENAKEWMTMRELELDTVRKYSGPMRNHIPYNEHREEFLGDLDTMTFSGLKKKWYKGPSLKLLISKYVYGSNRQKVNSYLRKKKRSNKRG